jgi:hypothetical protein
MCYLSSTAFSFWLFGLYFFSCIHPSIYIFKTFLFIHTCFGCRDLDKFDAFLGAVLMEAAKTESGTVRGVMPVDENDPTMKSKKSRRNRIPHPRTTKQLVRAVTPQIKSVAPETDGYKVACEAWEVRTFMIWHELYVLFQVPIYILFLALLT